MNWWTDFWTWVNDNQLAATIIGGLILAALLWGFSRLPKVGPHVRSGIKWLWSWRPVSSRRYESGLLRLHDVVTTEVEASAKVVAEKAITDSEELEKAKKELVRLMVEHRNTKDADATDDENPWGDLVAAPLPGPEPRWKLLSLDGTEGRARRYAIANLVPESVALNVRMDNSSTGWFSFDDAAFWPDLSGESRGEFKGEVTSTDNFNNARLKLTWFDENRVRQTMFFVIRGPKPEPDPWATASGSTDVPF
ncbi:hypothetical protein [Microbacterium paraoxydans]|uniref:hypothetical protein n=1 Tax=Microbacterium paraoxydans TaxID=199592 RepID=UPI00119DE484|nr:hypothetical protein [Microbacterium paraoxydans]